MDSETRLADLLVLWEELRDRGDSASAAELCGRHGCPELAHELEQRIRELQSIDKRFRDTTTDDAAVSTPSTDTDEPGEPCTGPIESIAISSRYRVGALKGKGGMGEVFVAHDEALGREVALKLIQRPRAADPDSRSRFLREVEITSRLEHPGVVPVYGLGHDADGQPCYAMRFIQGETLEQAIERMHSQEGEAQPSPPECPTLRQLLNRFIAVSNTIAYAHSRGILHRDIKPANIMLGKYGETLVVDWGLAKPFGRTEVQRRCSGEETLMPAAGSDGQETAAGRAVGTPAFMSPEQAVGRWDVVGLASDIYSLGATLYVLLTGQAPFQGSPWEVLQHVQRGDFPRPRELSRSVPPALEAICLKALAFEPQSRYATALELAADVERWLADEPVSAYREPWPERLTRLLRRHRTWAQATAAALLLVTAASLVAAVLINHQKGIAVAAQQAEEGQRKVAEAEREEADQARQRTRQALDDMTSQVASDWLATQKELRPEQKRFLEKAIEYYREFAAEVADDEGGRARAASGNVQLGHLLDRLGQKQDAERARRQAVALYNKLAADFPTVPGYRQDLAASLGNLGNLLAALGRKSGPESAEESYRQALVIFRELVAEFPATPGHRRNLGRTEDALGVVLVALGRLSGPDSAEEHFHQALAIAEKLTAELPTINTYRNDLAQSHNALGYLLLEFGRVSGPDSAEEHFRQALAIRDKLVMDLPTVAEHREDLAASHNNLGRLLAKVGRRSGPDSAEEHYRQALAIRDKLVIDFPAVAGYREQLATSYNNLGLILAELGRRSGPDSAEQHYRQALAICEKLVADFPTVVRHRQWLAGYHKNLGMLLDDLGRRSGPNSAEEHYGQAFSIQEKLAAEFPGVPGHRHELGIAHLDLGKLLKNLGRPSDLNSAEAHYRQALGIFEKLVADFPGVPGHRQELARSHQFLGSLLHDLGRRENAEAEYRNALGIREQLAADFPAAPEFRQELALSRMALGDLLRSLGRWDEAEAECRSSRGIREQLAADFANVPEHRQELANSYNALGDLLARLGRQDEAEAEYRKELNIREQLAVDCSNIPEYRLQLARSHNALGNTLDEFVGRHGDAEAEYRMALVIMEQLAAGFPTEIAYLQELARTHNDLGNVLIYLGRRDQAEGEYRKTLRIRERLAADGPSVPVHRQNLAGSYSNMGNLLHELGRHEDAEAEYRKSLRIREQLAADFPNAPSYRQELAQSHNNLAELLRRSARGAEAEEEIRKAIAIQEQLVANVPAVRGYGIGLGGSYRNFARLMHDAGRAEEALEWYAKAITNLEAVLEKEPRLANARQISLYAHWDRAQALGILNRHDEAVKDWNRCILLNDKEQRRPFFRLQRALSMAHAHEHAEAAGEADQLAVLDKVPGSTLYDLGCVFALCRVAAKEDARLREHYAARAIELLRRAQAAGFFKDPAAVEHLQKDPDLDSIREYPAYKELIEQVKMLTSPKEAKPPD